MEPPRPFRPDGVGGVELFAAPDAHTAAYHEARPRELERQARLTGNNALAEALRSVAGRYRATALDLAAAREPAGSRHPVAERPAPGAVRSFTRRAFTPRSA